MANQSGIGVFDPDSPVFSPPGSAPHDTCSPTPKHGDSRRFLPLGQGVRMQGGNTRAVPEVSARIQVCRDALVRPSSPVQELNASIRIQQEHASIPNGIEDQAVGQVALRRTLEPGVPERSESPGEIPFWPFVRWCGSTLADRRDHHNDVNLGVRQSRGDGQGESPILVRPRLLGECNHAPISLSLRNWSISESKKVSRSGAGPMRRACEMRMPRIRDFVDRSSFDVRSQAPMRSERNLARPQITKPIFISSARVAQRRLRNVVCPL
jgi:hypothetical protein